MIQRLFIIALPAQFNHLTNIVPTKKRTEKGGMWVFRVKNNQPGKKGTQCMPVRWLNIAGSDLV